MDLTDFYPAKGCFLPGELVRLIAEIESETHAEVEMKLRITHLADTIDEVEHSASVEPGSNEIVLEWRPKSRKRRGYGAYGGLIEPNEETEVSFSTAFDVLHAWTEYPRYGFLCDFYPDREDIRESLDALLRYHLNSLQFYDWQYRHDTLISPDEQIEDPLGRELSVRTIHQFVAGAHQRGMAAMPYLAAYAASKEFAQIHRDWALFDESGDPYMFEDFLGLMDPTAGAPWNRHLLKECADVLENTDFDGFHIDQYGEPRSGYNASGAPVNIPESFAAIIRDLKSRYPNAPVTLNAVKNWPIAALATAPLDFIYIEIWPDMPRYSDLARVIKEAREKSGNKPVVVALYLPPDRLVNIRLANALILSSGATRIEIGENERLLSDPYFPKHGAMDARLKQTLRAYADFSVRYSDLLGPWSKDVVEFQPLLPQGIWSAVRSSGNWIVINLINLRGIEDPHWTVSHPEPHPINDFALELDLSKEIVEIYAGSPDDSDMALAPISWEQTEYGLRALVPRLEFWISIVIQTKA